METDDNMRVSATEKYKRLVGHKIYSWTVLELDIDDDHYYAVCKCDCGTVKPVQIHNLISGKTKDCGCGRKRMLSDTRTKDLTGQRFGKLLVLELLPESNKFNRRQYLCKCDCGGQIIVTGSCLVNGHTRSCGCINSYYNMYVGQILDKFGVEYYSEKMIYVNEHNFRFDFYIPEYNLMIEYDGEHHYKPITYGTMTLLEATQQLKKRQLYDRMKDKYCADNDINLLRIPYWEKENIEEIIYNHLQRLSERDLAA